MPCLDASPEDIADFIWARITISSSGCWLWLGAKTRGGVNGRWEHVNRYGSMKVAGKSTRVHRWTFEHYREPIPPGFDLDHKVCDTSLCCNPFHVEPSTKPDNTRRRNANHRRHQSEAA